MLYNMQLFWPQGDAQEEERTQVELIVSLEEERTQVELIVSLDEACKAALEGRIVPEWPNTLSTSFGLDSCPYYVMENHYITAPLSPEEAAFPLAYAMAIGEDFETFERLFRAIYMPQNVYCVHIDKAAPLLFKMAVIELLSCFSNTFLSSQSEYVIHGGISRLQAVLACMKDLLGSQVQWRYVINTCGHDFPLKTNREIVRYLKTLKGQNVTPRMLPVRKLATRVRYVHRPHRTSSHAFLRQRRLRKSPPPKELQIHFGSMYVALTRKFVHFALFDKRATELLSWSQDTYGPDEHFWITLNKIPDAPGSMAQEVPAASLRAVKWMFQEETHKGCHGHYWQGMCVYGPGDLKWLYESPSMFANKLQLEAYPLTVECLELRIRERMLNQSEVPVQLDWYLLPK
ncbi:N-acetyllactosaminide beta-1,6-N-acetylglucosaminyl-transferase [Ochotona princeps]|uniref:N-acetyllactosaminide beta-1,6-N-acetylglucosaminyl-transferase n=1 Tax=Ochotona princeps TaxID=9978 RepID=UPI0027147B61|nr:N-acetyllactosaminide beta-1,6-N-acetylglucosaminyl-transferase [Ochotona princeps]